MTTLDQYFKTESDGLYRALIAENQKVDPALIKEAVIAHDRNQVLQDIEVRLVDHSGYSRLLYILKKIQEKYSNQYVIYGIREEPKSKAQKADGVTYVQVDGDSKGEYRGTIVEIQHIVQLTLKNPAKLFDLAKESYVSSIKPKSKLKKSVHLNDLKESGLLPSEIWSD